MSKIRRTYVWLNNKIKIVLLFCSIFTVIITHGYLPERVALNPLFNKPVQMLVHHFDPYVHIPSDIGHEYFILFQCEEHKPQKFGHKICPKNVTKLNSRVQYIVPGYLV